MIGCYADWGPFSPDIGKLIHRPAVPFSHAAVELGVAPAAASATSTLMVLFSASTAVLAFAAAHRLNLQYGATFGCACLAAAAAGTFLIGRAVRRSGHASVLVLLLAGIIGVGAAVTLALSGGRIVLDLVHGN